MQPKEKDTHTFLVKFWLTESAEEDGRLLWRGTITHLQSGQRRYLLSVDDIVLFMLPYLTGVRIRIPPGWRIRSWWRRFRRDGH